MADNKKKCAKCNTPVKIDCSKYDYDYWSSLGRKMKKKMYGEFVDRFGFDALGKRATNGNIGRYFDDPAIFTMSENTPLGTITVTLLGNITKVGKEDGFAFDVSWSTYCKLCDEADAGCDIEYSAYANYFVEVIEAICDHLTGLMRKKFSELYHECCGRGLCICDEQE